MHTLVTLIGRTYRPEEGYQRVEYQFPDGDSHRTSFVGYSLAARERPDRLVILGTSGSMWDQLLEEGLSIDIDEAEHVGLMESVDQGRTSEAQLRQLAPALSRALGTEVELRLIPEGNDEAGQTALLHVLVGATQAADTVTLDITHGYRHLPMLMVMAVLYLRAFRPELTVNAIWYAMLHQAEGRATMHNVGGILHFADWLSALQRSELTGDYLEVSRLIDDPEIAADLEAGGFLEAIHQGQLAKGHFRRARKRLQEHPLSGAGALFQPLLEQRTEWVESRYLYQRQRMHAFKALERGDLLRATLYGFEANITRLVGIHGPTNADPNDRGTRDEAKREYEANGPANADWRSYKRLKALRNVLAHGNRDEEGYIDGSLLRSPQAVRTILEETLTTLLPET